MAVTLSPKAVAWAKRLIQKKIDQEGLYLSGANYELSGRQLLEAIAYAYHAGLAAGAPKTIRLLEDAQRALLDEMNAAGEGETRQHPTLRRHSRVYDRIAEFLDQSKEKA